MTVSGFRGPGLTDAQWRQVEGLATSLDPNQLIWLSGFFAGVEHRVRERPRSDDPQQPTAIENAVATRHLTVLYGSETGNSSAVARSFFERAKGLGLAARLEDMANYKTRQLKDEQDLVIVTSTYGEGDPPQPAASFFEFVEGRKAPKLPDVRFAVLALGDSTYERYCEAGKRLDRRFEELGAKRLKSRVDCDVDYEDSASAWSTEILEIVGDGLGDEKDIVPAWAAEPRQATNEPHSAFDKRNPFPARILDKIELTGRGSSKQILHLELSLEGSGLTFAPGDAIGVAPSNDPALVERIVEEVGLDAAAQVEVKGAPLPLRQALTSHYEITAVTPRFLEQWAKITEAAELKELVRADSSDARSAFMKSHHIIDVIRRFPAKTSVAENLTAGLRPLQPRLYSLASSLTANPSEAHLTVSVLRYDLHGEMRTGVASDHFAHRSEPDGVLPVYIQQSPHFRLPAADTPIIMIGAGTGIAPYRAFMQEREAEGSPGRSWLFFGERNFRTDFLYQTEWQTLLKQGVLTRMDVAFSRDRRSNKSGKFYIQNRIKEHARDVYAWLEEGAHVYVCGDAGRFAPDVHQAIKDVLIVQGYNPAAATEYLARLQNEHRYQVDVY